MYRSKREVDRHVQEVLRKIKNEHERNLRCYHIAQQYYRVREYECARRYVSQYLAAKEDSPLAHCLLGQSLEALGHKERALAAYKASLELEPKQPELVLKICELMCETDLSVDVERARYWCDRAAEQFPHDPAVFRLKERLLTAATSHNTQAFEDLINSEMRARPMDVGVRVRLLRLYMETGRTEAALSHGMEVEARQAFGRELSWYECLSAVCQAYQEELPAHCDTEFYYQWTMVLDRVAALSLSETCPLATQRTIADCVHAIYNLDQTLRQAHHHHSGEVGADHVLHSSSSRHTAFMQHYGSQLCLHMANVIFKRAKKEQGNWKEATRCATPLLLLCVSPPIDTEGAWLLCLKEAERRQAKRWAELATYRFTQAGNVLLSLAKDSGSTQFMDKVAHTTTGNWREKIFQRVFTTHDHRADMATSHFLTHRQFAQLPTYLPMAAAVRSHQCVSASERVQPGSLHHLVWLGLQELQASSPATTTTAKLPLHFRTHAFPDLQLTVRNLANNGVETLNVLDLDSFLYATLLCASALHEEQQLNGFYCAERPATLPADITSQLCTPEQADWWSLAYQVYQKCVPSIGTGGRGQGQVRQTVQWGIETVRLAGNHGLDVHLIVQIAHIFADRAASADSKGAEAEGLTARALLYWNTALPLLERLQRDQAIASPPQSRLFHYQAKELAGTDLSSLLEEGRFFVACQLMKEEQYERAIELFRPLRSPYAAFHQATIYKKLAEAELSGCSAEEITSEMRSRHVILLSKAKESLYTTRDKIRQDRRHPLHSTLRSHLDHIEAQLSRIEPDIVMRSGEIDGLSELGSISSQGSPGGGDNIMGGLSYPLSALRLGGEGHRRQATSTPRHHHQPDYRPFASSTALIELGQLLQQRDTVMLEKLEKIMGEKFTQFELKFEELRRELKSRGAGGGGGGGVGIPDDLYGFGEDEDYSAEDVLAAAQYPGGFPQFSTPPQPYYPARGVQGASTVTYGAPPQPIIPPPQTALPPQFFPHHLPSEPLAYPTPPSIHHMGFLGGLPFGEGQGIPEFFRTLPSVIPKPQPPPPVNVVITTSDTLPTGPPLLQPTLSVTIPPQHRLGTSAMFATAAPVHAFQIPMPTSAHTLHKSPIAIAENLESDDETEVERDPCPDFKPIIPLPDEVAVMTGEEGETVLFENRAKLYRFVEKEWKERGLGTMKLLKDTGTGRARVLMRRDHVHKICANHLLRPEMELTPMVNTDRAWVWLANDFADEQFNLEKLCVKFKTVEEAERFRKVFDEAKATSTIIVKKVVGEKQSGEIYSPSSASSEKVKVGGFTFSSTPLIRQPDSIAPTEPEKAKKDVAASPSPFAAFSFSSPRSPATLTPVQQQDKISMNLFASIKPPTSGVSLTPSPKVVFKESVLESVVKSTNSQPKSILKESLQKGTSPASTREAVATPTPPATTQKHVLFQEPRPVTVSPISDVLFSPQTNLLDFSDVANKSGDGSFKQDTSFKGFDGAGGNVFGKVDSLVDDDFVPTVEFQPVVPLPDIVEVRTGEEDEAVLFCDRAKLLCLDVATKEWKERGIGPMKLLRHRTTGCVRLLMRREQVHKVCCNQRVTPATFQLRPMSTSDKAWTWYAQDYSEGELANGMFAVRFKTAQLANAFKSAVDDALEELKKPQKTGAVEVELASPHQSAMDSAKSWKCPHCMFPNTNGSRTCRACEKTQQATLPKLTDLFRPKPGTWQCAVCYLSNDGASVQCVSCLGPKSPTTIQKRQEKINISLTTQEKPPLTELFKPKAGSWTCATCYISNDATSIHCVACQMSKSPLAKQKLLEKPKVLSTAQEKPPLAELFKPKAGSWECAACYTSNNANSTQCVACQEPKISPATTQEKPSLAELFKPKAGSWECDGCMVRNDETTTVCPACNTAKPGHAKPVTTGFSFGGGANFTFGIAKTENETGGFSFGMPAKTETSANFTAAPIKLTDVKQAPSFSFGGQSSVPSFSFAGGPATTAAVTNGVTQPTTFTFGRGDMTPVKNGNAGGGQGFAFGSTNKFEFNFSGVRTASSPRSPRRSSANQETESEGEDNEAEGDSIHFSPVVPMPDEVAVTTGEEQEVVLYEHRAKLYRFIKGEWKERGVGQMKLLRHMDTGKIRFLMRREPILKLCLNHFLTPDLPIRRFDDRTWLWSAADFSDSELTTQSFALRFKTADIAADFMLAVQSAQGELQGIQSTVANTSPDSTSMPKDTSHNGGGAEEKEVSPAMKNFSFTLVADENSIPTPQTLGAARMLLFSDDSPQCQPSDTDVEIVYDSRRVTAEQMAAALRLQLPPNFYAYLDCPPCPGCIGCEPEEEQDQGTMESVSSAQPLLGSPLSTSSLFSWGQQTLPLLSNLSISQADKGSPSTPPFGDNITASLSSAIDQEAKPLFADKQSFLGTNLDKQSLFGSTPDKPTFFSGSPGNNTTLFGGKTSEKPFTFGSSPFSSNADKSFSFGVTVDRPSPFDGSTVKQSPFADTPDKPSLFGNVPNKQRLVSGSTDKPFSLFGGTLGKQSSFADTPDKPSSFGDTTSKETLFGGNTYKPAPFAGSRDKQSLFGGTAEKSSAFGSSTDKPSFFGGTTGKSSLFGGTADKLSVFSGTTDKPSVFGGTTDKPSVFGSTTDKPSLFGGTADKPSVFGGTMDKSSIFGGTTDKPSFFGGTMEKTSVFGGTTDRPSFFGGTMDKPSAIGGTTDKSSVFGGTMDKPSVVGGIMDKPSVVGGITDKPSVFGGTILKPSLFGGTMDKPSFFGDTVDKPSLFGGAADTNARYGDRVTKTFTFSAAEDKPTLFGGAATIQPMLSGFATAKPSVLSGPELQTPPQVSSVGKEHSSGSAQFGLDNADPQPALVPKFLQMSSEESPTFESIAASTPPVCAFIKEGSARNSDFLWSGAGSTVFGNVSTSAAANKSATSDGGDAEGEGSCDEGEAEYDPQYEPIVPLPAAITVTTGEEEETKVFGERAKLFRYDPELKQWKERGVGELKILHHPANRTYRLLLRREQVHKLVCNQLVTGELELSAMLKSDKAWCWTGWNVAQDYETPALEQLAVRFKTSELADRFKQLLEESVAAVRAGKVAEALKLDQEEDKLLPLAVAEMVLEEEIVDQSEAYEEEVEEEEERGDYDEDEDDDEEEEEEDGEVDEGDDGVCVMFNKRATLLTRPDRAAHWSTKGSGMLRIVHHSDVFMSHVLVTQDNTDLLLCDSIVTSNTPIQIEGTACVWRGKDRCSDANIELMAKFSNKKSAIECCLALNEGKGYCAAGTSRTIDNGAV